MLTDTVKSQIIDFLSEAFGSQLLGIVLYGSQARGDATAKSDIDLAVLLDRPVAAYPLWDTAQALACQLRKDVDLIALRDAATVLQKEVIEHGEWLVKNDELACNLFDTRVISMYQHLNEERRDIVNDLVGKIKNG